MRNVRWVVSRLRHGVGASRMRWSRVARATAVATVCHRHSDRASDSTTDAQVDDLVARAQTAQRAVEDWDEDRIDVMLCELSEVVSSNAEPLASAAVAETEMGNAADKSRKIEYAARAVYGSLVGRVGRGPIGTAERGVTAVACPVGVVFALLPVTNPVATMINEVLICLKGRNALVLSPHPRAQRVSEMALALLEPVFRTHGAPLALIQIVPGPLSQHRTELVMEHQGIALVLVTGGVNIVKAAYRSGTPTIGVGPGNAPAYVATDADLAAAARAIVEGKAFDNGIICGSEQHIVADRAIATRLLEELRRAGAVILDAGESDRLLQTAFDPVSGGLKPQWTGRSAREIAAAAHINRRYPFRLLVFAADRDKLPAGARRERLAPITAFHTVRDAIGGIETCRALLAEGGAGHTAAVHTNSDELIARFATELPVSRLLVNSPAGLACVGIGNGLTPSFILGCGTFGRTSTTDNVTYLNLLNIKRVAQPLNEVSDLPTPRDAADKEPSAETPSPVSHG